MGRVKKKTSTARTNIKSALDGRRKQICSFVLEKIIQTIELAEAAADTMSSAHCEAEERGAAQDDSETLDTDVSCSNEWQRFELRCVLSFQRLNDPAKGSHCEHRACCNYQVLRNYAGRVGNGKRKECPLATCNALLQRSRDVERDCSLQAMLTVVPESAETVWLRGDQVRTTPPQEMQRSLARVRRIKRKALSGGAPAQSST